MKNIFRKILIFSIPFIFIMFINLTIDNAYIFRSNKMYEKIGKLIASGNNISNLYNYNEFLVRKYAIRHMSGTPDIISFGSSRSMQINSSIFNNKIFFNMAISATSLKEIIASYNVIYEKGFNPETIIIGIDANIFFKNTSRLREYFVDDFNSFTIKAMLNNSVEIVNSKDKYYELINPVYFFNNLIIGKKKYSKTKSIFIEKPVVCFDGSYVYNSKKRNQTQEEILQETINQFNKRINKQYKNLSNDSELQSLFEDFIVFLKKRHNIILFLAPYHPFIAEKFKHIEFNGIQEVEKYITQISINYNIDLIGSFDPLKYDYKISSFDFYDGVHPKREIVERIFKDQLK